MEPRTPKWSPGGPNGAQEAQMEPRRLKWSPGGANGAHEAQMESRRPKWSPGGPNGAREAQNGAQEVQMELIFDWMSYSPKKLEFERTPLSF